MYFMTYVKKHMPNPKKIRDEKIKGGLLILGSVLCILVVAIIGFAKLGHKIPTVSDFMVGLVGDGTFSYVLMGMISVVGFLAGVMAFLTLKPGVILAQAVMVGKDPTIYASVDAMKATEEWKDARNAALKEKSLVSFDTSKNTVHEIPYHQLNPYLKDPRPSKMTKSGGWYQDASK